MRWERLLLKATALLLLAGCGAPVVKPEAISQDILGRESLPSGGLSAGPGEELILHPGPAWLGDVQPAERLTFAGYRPGDDSLLFCLVLAIDPASDRLILLPLAGGLSPLEILSDPRERGTLKEILRTFGADGEIPSGTLVVSLSRSLEERRLGPPVPSLGHVYAVAANYPSHLEEDLALDEANQKRAVLRQARPRVFLKFPPVAPPGLALPAAPFEFTRLLGPFDELIYPATIALPPEKPGEPNPVVVTRLDYEAEIGVVLGRTLTWETVRESSDDELRAAVVGYLLISDAKARNPQVMGKIVRRDEQPPEDNAYRIDDPALDKALGVWDEETCRWWSYAAGWGGYTSAGPFLAEAEGGVLPPLALISARSYAPSSVRGQDPPEGHRPEFLYLRQGTLTTEDPAYGDALIWSVPQILRSILDPEGNALGFLGEGMRLEPGDIVSLGTPGGTVITSRPGWVLSVLDTLLFWQSPLDWHDLFFEGEAPNYLLPGDQLFLWAQGLGYQLLTVGRPLAIDTLQP